MALAAMVGVAGSARADIYRAVDARGVVHLSNVPSGPGYALMIRDRHERATPATDASRTTRTAAHLGHFAKVVARAAREQAIDKALLQAVIAVESDYDPGAKSDKGAVGLMQLMPATAQRYGVTDRYDPVANVHAGARYLHDLMQKFDGNLSLALAAYNAGEAAVERFGNRIPPYPETRSYVPRVLDLYRHYRSRGR